MTSSTGPHRPPPAPTSALSEVTEECTRIRQLQARRTAVDTLEAIANSAVDPIERRRAASSLLRSDQPRRPLRAPDESSLHAPIGRERPPRHGPTNAFPLEDRENPPRCQPNSPHRAPSLKPDPDCIPTPSLSPEELVYRRFEDFIAHDDFRRPGANLFAFLTPGAIICGSPAPQDLHQFLREQSHGPLFAHSCLFHTQETARTESAATVTVSLVTRQSTLAPRFRISLERSDSGPHPGCWLISRIDEDQVPRRETLPAHSGHEPVWRDAEDLRPP